jgi:predicted RNA-binding Zn-ribbon protein involved in translation (DUF1610 family)
MAKITLEQVMDAVATDNYMGICVKCGYEQEGVEPDARKYECEDCGEHKVYGAEELLFMMGGYNLLGSK